MPVKDTGHRYCSDSLFQQLQLAGEPQLIIRSDGEPAILDLKHAVMRRARVELGLSVTPEESSLGDSASNGQAEEAVKAGKAKVRTLKHAAEHLHKTCIGPTHPSLPWMCLHAAALINRARPDVSGRTPWELRHGRAWKAPIVPFSEKCM